MFWVLDRPKNRWNDCIYATISGIDNQPTWESLTCPACGRARHTKQIRDLSVELYGSVLCEFVWTDSPDVLVSNSLMNLLNRSNLNGFTFRSIEVVAWWRTDKEKRETVNWLEQYPAPLLFQLVVLGKGGSIVPQNQTHIESTCAVCGGIVYAPLEKGILVDERQWDGSDMFVMDEFPGYVLVTERLLQYLETHQIQNYRAVPADKFSMIQDK